MRKILLAGMIGNGLEWYDYALYAYMTLTISKLFFPVGNDAAHLLATLGIFAVGAMNAGVIAIAIAPHTWALDASSLLSGKLAMMRTSAISSVGGGNARLFQVAFVIGSTTAVLTILSSPWVRAWAKVKLAKHFFRHRYDYRAEWRLPQSGLGIIPAQGGG